MVQRITYRRRCVPSPRDAAWPVRSRSAQRERTGQKSPTASSGGPMPRPGAPERAASDRPARRPATRVGAVLPRDTMSTVPALGSSPRPRASSPARRARVDARVVAV